MFRTFFALHCRWQVHVLYSRRFRSSRRKPRVERVAEYRSGDAQTAMRAYTT